jgi:hypothetical protein
MEPDCFHDQELFIKTKTEANKRQRSSIRPQSEISPVDPNFDRFRKLLRDRVFTVTDKSLRDLLIWTERQLYESKIRLLRRSLSETESSLHDIATPIRNLIRTLSGTFVVALGWQFDGAMGGIAAAIFIMLYTMYYLDERRWLRQVQVQRVTAQIADLKGAVEIVEQQEVFSLEEEFGDEPDSK